MCVSGSPPKPTQEVMEMMEVMEGSSVSLCCSIKIFCPMSHPPSLKWSSSLNVNVIQQQYQSQTELISDLNFTVTHYHHGVTFTCTATHQLQQQITTQDSDANPAVNYTWYRDTEELLNPVQTGPDLTINNIKLTHSGRYYCTAQNKHGTQNTSVLLDVQQTHFCLHPADD
ncbi:hypothetical protein M9458_010120 [Cirrhinus mrigala]|uniref:Ig-like domain-containing protein n=1 Tax=Cirrhinus mrigala TaxID=683832 RepID=A0ABD0RF71_CIRMR